MTQLEQTTGGADERVAVVLHSSDDQATVSCGTQSFRLERHPRELPEFFRRRVYESAKAFLPGRIEVIDREEFEKLKAKIESEI
jgi:hypothetical protein